MLYVYLVQLNVAAQWQTVLFFSFLFLWPAFFFSVKVLRTYLSYTESSLACQTLYHTASLGNGLGTDVGFSGSLQECT